MSESVRQGTNNALLMRTRQVKLVQEDGVDDVEIQKRMKAKLLLFNALKETEQEVKSIRKTNDARLKILYFNVLVAMIGLALSIIISEACRYGYIPTNQEIAEGMYNPYDDPTKGCRDKPRRIIVLQLVVSVCTVVLASSIIYGNYLNYKMLNAMKSFVLTRQTMSVEFLEQIKEYKIFYWNDMIYLDIREILLACVVHPLPGYFRTIVVEQMNRTSIYQFQSLIVIFMFLRLWHIAKLLLHLFYRYYFEESIFVLGNTYDLVKMFEQKPHVSHTLMFKTFLRCHPVRCIASSFLCLLFVAAYCIRIAEGSSNIIHSVYFWNQMWMVIVTMTTTGYGGKGKSKGRWHRSDMHPDMYPSSHFGRLICIVVMLLGILLVSIMTAIMTTRLSLTQNETDFLKYTELQTFKKAAVVASVKFLQQIYRTNRGKQKKDPILLNKLRRALFKATYIYNIYLKEVEDNERKPAEGRADTEEGERSLEASGHLQAIISSQQELLAWKNTVDSKIDALQGSLDQILEILKANDRQFIPFRTDVSDTQVSPAGGGKGGGRGVGKGGGRGGEGGGGRGGEGVLGEGGGESHVQPARVKRRHVSRPKSISAELLNILPSIDYTLSRSRSNSRSRDEDLDMAKQRERLRRQSVKMSPTGRLLSEDFKSSLRSSSLTAIPNL